MKVIGLGLQKGGVGKTSVSVALAAELAKSSKVLLIDADPQGNASGALLKEIGYELADALLDNCSVDGPVTKTEIEKQKLDNLLLLVAKAIGIKLFLNREIPEVLVLPWETLESEFNC